MTVIDCPTCGGTHFGSNTCPFVPPARSLTVREWFRGMRHGDEAVTFAVDIEHAIQQPEVCHGIRLHNIVLIFDLAKWNAWQVKSSYFKGLSD